MSAKKQRCGWPDPAPNTVICRRCHGVLIFDYHTYQWRHAR